MRRLLLSLAVLSLLTAVLALSPDTAGAGAAATLNLSGSTFGDGEYVTLEGSVGTKVRRPAVLQALSGSWQDVTRLRTDSRGRFAARIHVAGGTSTSSYRVYAPRFKVRRHVYPAVTTKPQNINVTPQDVALSFPGLEANNIHLGTVNLFNDQAAPGAVVKIVASTTPVRPGRTLALQVRDADGTWTDAADPETADSLGQVGWNVTLPPTLPVVYRAVASAYDGMSAYDSLPRYVWAPGQEPLSGPTDPIGGSRTTLDPQPGPVSAASTFKWGNPVENYSWEAGESIAPWTEYADGTGRVTDYMAMLTLDNGLQDGRFRGFGDISSTLNAAGHAYGRWEMRVRAPIFPVGNASVGRNYGFRLQLVPAGSSPTYDCSDSITMGAFTGYGDQTTVGANNGTASWTATISGAQRNRENWHTYAVEVTPKRISWFIDAKVVATLNNTAAYTAEDLVPRLAMDGAGDQVWMNHSKLTADWVRYFSLDRPDAKPTAASAAWTQRTFTGGC